ncbi:MAG: ATP-binding protein [Candidatus Aenigmatarchaeota archaeon]
MKTVTIVSGKGGVGKSSIAASLAVCLSKERDIATADCDVDASNLALILGVEKFETLETISTNEKAVLDEERCTSCGKCRDICTFSAIDWDEERDVPAINEYMCEGCGACELACPENAFELKTVENAEIGKSLTGHGFPLVSGQLKMGEAGSGKVVDEIKRRTNKEEAEVLIVDSAAGIGCPVIASVRGSDYIVAVTEPSPSGLSDLKRVLEIVNHFGIDYGIIINKYDLNKEFTGKIEEFVEERNAEILAKIPYDKEFVDSLVEMEPIVERRERYRKIFSEFGKKILNKVK